MPVGEKLAAERRKQGKSLNDVVAATNIMGRHLDSLENGRLDQMPTAVYVRGFIQGYAKYLGIPAAPLLAEYEADLGGKRPRSRLEDVPERTVVPMRDQLHHIPGRTWLAILGRTPHHRRFRLQRHRRRWNRPRPLPASRRTLCPEPARCRRLTRLHRPPARPSSSA
jgi:transcriptional regulator with XRE-family HTH domain